MRAVVQRVEIGAAGLQPPPHFVVAHLDKARSDQALRHARLVGDDDQLVAGALEQPQRVHGPRKQLEILQLVQVADVDVQRAVAVEEDGFFHDSDSNALSAVMPRMQR